MTRAAKVLAQAKVNLTLIVGPKDDTGYHEIFTVFQRLDLADEVIVTVGGQDRTLRCNGPRLPKEGLGPAEKNLAFRAATAYAERTGWPDGFVIELGKFIPVGGGLGGGSADAGAVLRALDALAPTPAGDEAIAEIAYTLGADVPFLASPHAVAAAAGRGERLFPEDPLPARNVALVIPSFGVATADAYRWLDESRARTPSASLGSGIELEADEMLADSWDGILDASMNHFEPVVEQRHPELAKYRQRLTEKGAFLARLSGSGSTVFGLFEGTAPDAKTLGLDALVIPTRTSERVVQVEVLE